MKELFDTEKLVVGAAVNVLKDNDSKPYECSYEVTFNGEDRVDLAMVGSGIGWVPRFNITLTPPDGTQVYKMLYEFVNGLSPRPFENMGVEEYETNVEVANDQLETIKRELVEMALASKPFVMPKTWRVVFDFMIRPVMRFSSPVFAEDIKFAHPIPKGFADLGFVKAQDIEPEIGMALMAQYGRKCPYEPCTIIDAEPFFDAPEILFQVKFSDGRTIGVFNDELVKIISPEEDAPEMYISADGTKGVITGIDPGSKDGDQIGSKLFTDFGDRGVNVDPDDLTDPV